MMGMGEKGGKGALLILSKEKEDASSDHDAAGDTIAEYANVSSENKGAFLAALKTYVEACIKESKEAEGDSSREY
jgi:hypothetical protein